MPSKDGQSAKDAPVFGESFIELGTLTETRCFHCHRLLLKAALEGGSFIEVKCPWCNQFTRVRAM